MFGRIGADTQPSSHRHLKAKLVSDEMFRGDDGGENQRRKSGKEVSEGGAMLGRPEGKGVGKLGA